MANLFERGPLEQTTGDLKERWQQDGSTQVNAFLQRTGDGTLYTVTAGKTFFITQIIIARHAGGTTIALKDGGAGGTTRITLVASINTTPVVTLTTPLAYTTDVYADMDGNDDCSHTLIGWEE